MKKFRSLLIAGACWGLLLGLFASGAHALPRCSVVCTPTASCDLECAAIGGGSPEITTCGNWGICAGFTAASPADDSLSAIFASNPEPAATAAAESTIELAPSR